MADQFVCCSYLDYEDGSASVAALARGDLETCKRVMDMTPGVTYSGNRKAISASIEILPAATFDRLMKGDIGHQTN